MQKLTWKGHLTGSWYRENTTLDASRIFSSGSSRNLSKIADGAIAGLMDAASKNSRHCTAVRGWLAASVARAVEPPLSRMAAWKGGSRREEGDCRW